MHLPRIRTRDGRYSMPQRFALDHQESYKISTHYTLAINIHSRTMDTNLFTCTNPTSAMEVKCIFL